MEAAQEKAIRASPSPPVEAREFLVFLKEHGIEVQETTKNLWRRDAGMDDKAMERRLHCGLRLLLTSSRRRSCIPESDKLRDLLVKQSEHYLSSNFDVVKETALKIDRCLKVAARMTKNMPKETETTLTDIPTYGGTKVLPHVNPSVSISTGIEREVDVGMLEPQKVTLKVKGDCNVINVGKAMDHSNERPIKKIARLERALTYMTLRANASDIEEVVKYAPLYMLLVIGSPIGSTKDNCLAALGSTIINLNVDMFPYLAKLQKERGLACCFDRKYILAERRLEILESFMWVAGAALMVPTVIFIVEIASAFHHRKR